MTNAQKPDGSGQPDFSGQSDDRVAKQGGRPPRRTADDAPPSRGIAGSFAQDRDGYRSEYGAENYGKAGPHADQTVHGGQQGALQSSSGDPKLRPSRPEGHAGSKATLPGAGADKGPKT
ncbi:MAG: hypothetical protein ACKOXK_05290 [Chakrabartia sp.]